MAKRTDEAIRLTIKADLQELSSDDERPPARAYLFSPVGELLDSEPLDAKGKATFTTQHGTGKARRFRVVIGPETERVHQLSDLRSQTKVIQANLGQELEVPFEIPKVDWDCWWGVIYAIVGSVKKRIDVDADTTLLLPICNATVEIYEVDYKKCILTLPDSVLEKIRASLIERIVPHPPWPPIRVRDPLPPPPPQPIELPNAPEFAFEAAAAESAAAFPQMAAMESLDTRRLVETVDLTTLRSGTTVQLRNLLLDQAQIFKPLLCYLLLPYFCYKKELIATATTDAEGHFSKIVVFHCPTEEPDLYFKVKQFNAGFTKTIYAPKPVPCYTYWNYKSGTEVNIVVTDPDAIACETPIPPDKEGCYIMPLGIGFDGWYDIDHAHIKPPHVPASYPNRGLYNGADPYGRQLDFTMQFHDCLWGNDVRYYRWSFRPEGSSADWQHINEPITHRHLTYISGKPALKAEPLGPNPVGSETDLFQIPDPNLDWVSINKMDRSFARWSTDAKRDGIALSPDGKYELRLEIFDSAGNKVTPASHGFIYYLPTASVTAGIWPVDDNLHVETDGSLILRLHIDNQDTRADIQSLALNTSSISDCQFMNYTDKATDQVTLTYQADHPHGFLASYSLYITRGTSGTTVASLSSSIPAPAGTTRFYNVGYLLRQVGALGPYDQCAFAVRLHTYPRTRNGYSRIPEYEAHDDAAFALVKAP